MDSHATHDPEPVSDLKVPAGHAEHDPAGPVYPAAHSFTQSPTASLPAAELVPEGQFWHVDVSLAPTAPEYVPAEHGTQSDSASFPIDPRYLPGPQLSHVAVPAEAEYLPAAQLSHAALPACAEYVPASHVRHMLSAVAPRVASILPATHAMHSPAPASVLYFPTAHAEHDPPFAPEYPALHMHAVEDALPVSEIELDGQDAHSLAP